MNKKLMSMLVASILFTGVVMADDEAQLEEPLTPTTTFQADNQVPLEEVVETQNNQTEVEPKITVTEPTPLEEEPTEPMEPTETIDQLEEKDLPTIEKVTPKMVVELG